MPTNLVCPQVALIPLIDKPVNQSQPHGKTKRNTKIEYEIENKKHPQRTQEQEIYMCRSKLILLTARVSPLVNPLKMYEQRIYRIHAQDRHELHKLEIKSKQDNYT